MRPTMLYVVILRLLVMRPFRCFSGPKPRSDNLCGLPHPSRPQSGWQAAIPTDFGIQIQTTALSNKHHLRTFNEVRCAKLRS